MAERSRPAKIGCPWRAAAAGVVIVVAVLAAACSAAADPVLPTVRPTYTPSIEATASQALKATATSTATPADLSATAGPSPTALLGDTPTRPRYTLTPTTQAILPGTLQIEYFTTSATSVAPGDKLTLFWSVRGVTKAIIYRLDAKGKREQLWNVSRAGSLEVETRTSDRDTAQFLLYVGDDTTHLEQTLSIPLKCGESWFFEPPPTSCPSSPVLASAEVQQTFQRGLMIWVQAQSRVYVLYNDGQKPAWDYFPDEFKDGQPDRDPALVPPQGLLQPIRGFGLVWRTRSRVRDRLGWATAAEAPFDGSLQGDATVDGGVMYIRAKDSNILQLSDNGASWKLITP